MDLTIFQDSHVIISPITKGVAMEIGARIKKLRLEMGMTQNLFAEELNIHAKQLAKYEAGRSVPVLEIVARIAAFCEVSTDFLIFGEDKSLTKKTKINDSELMDSFRQVNKLKKPERDKVKWIINSILKARTA